MWFSQARDRHVHGPPLGHDSIRNSYKGTEILTQIGYPHINSNVHGTLVESTKSTSS